MGNTDGYNKQSLFYFATVLSLVQSVIGIVIGSLSVALFFCEPLLPNFINEEELETNTWLKFLYVYFYDVRTMNSCYDKRGETAFMFKRDPKAPTLEQGALITPGMYPISGKAITSPGYTNKYFMGYIVACFVWLVVSVLQLNGVIRKKYDFCVPWIIVTSGMCLFDLVLFGIYCVDLSITVDNLVTEKSPDWSLFYVSLFLPLYFSKLAFIIWVTNVVCTAQIIKAVSGLHKHHKLRSTDNTSRNDTLPPKKPDVVPDNDQVGKIIDTSPHQGSQPEAFIGGSMKPFQQLVDGDDDSFKDGRSSRSSSRLPVLRMSNSPKFKRSQEVLGERKHFPRASFEIPQKVNTEGMIKIEHNLLKSQGSIRSNSSDNDFRYQRPWSYLRPNQPLNKTFESRTTAKSNPKEGDYAAPYDLGERGKN
ncbi:uncharacterized protein LOC136038547 [Artemia franciscana]|uniref:uncharacterized protein LOC136038547 n=1 Tax=Artemia franciscana TaxID=6661 RepID=UPI0032DBB9C0